MIEFGTDGWRAVLAKDFTFDNIARVAGALSILLKNRTQNVPGVVVAYDTRFLSAEFAEHFAQIVASYDIPVWLSKTFVPTPVLSFSVKQMGLSAGVMVTASHNPYYYNGLKFKAPFGGPVNDDFTLQLKRVLPQKAPVPDATLVKKNLQKVDLKPAYMEHLFKLLHAQSLGALNQTVVYDAMYGCGMGILRAMFKTLSVPAHFLRHRLNPWFSKKPPEPIAEHLKGLKKAVQYHGALVGLATDGDADRCGVLDEQGRFVQLHDLMPLLARYLVEERKFPGHFVRTTSMHSTIDRMAQNWQRNVYEVPVGFKHITSVMLQQKVLIGAEESGGFGFGFHLPERDGILTSLLVLEMLGHYQVKISELIEMLRQQFGPFFYKRIDFYYNTQTLKKNLHALKHTPPQRIAGMDVKQVDTKDGIKIYLQNGAWVLIRVSQTEPLARVYVAGPDNETVQHLCQWGTNIMKQS